MITDRLKKYNSGKGGIIKKLIILNIIIFVLINIIGSLCFLTSGADYNPALKFLALPVSFDGLLLSPWTIITHMFLHEGFMHILFNMLWLWWMGKIVSSFVSQKEILKLYIFGGLFGAILILMFSDSLNLQGIAFGASAAVMAIIVAAGILDPNKPINLLFLFQVRLKWIVITIVCLDCLFDLSSNTGGKIGHLGGAIFGLVYAKYFLQNNFSFRSNYKVKPKTDDEYRGYMRNKKDEIDFYLEKISLGGYKSLSEKEKERLRELSES